MNYILLAGVAIFGSSIGALLIVIIDLTRTSPRGFRHRGGEKGSDK